MIYLFTVLHIIVCFVLIIVVLLQSGGKGADVAAAFGGMGSQTAFGPRGSATLLSKATTGAAALFMLTSLSLAIIWTRNGGGSNSVLDRKNPAMNQIKKPATTPLPHPSLPQSATPAPAQPPVTGTPAPAGAKK